MGLAAWEILQHPGSRLECRYLALRNSREVVFFGAATWGLVVSQGLLET